MATDLGELIYTLTLNDSGFAGQLDAASNKVKEASGQMTTANEEVEESSGKAGGAFTDMAGQFVAGAAIFTIGQKALDLVKSSIGDAIQAAKDWQTQQQGLQAELKSTHDASGLTADQVQGLAENIQDTTPISREAALAGDNMLLTFTNLGKNVFPQASQAVADMATRMNAGAVPSAQQMSQTALQLGKALNDPATGMMMLRREGVTFSAQQQEQIKTMEKSGDTMGAQKLMLAELSKEFGGSAAANVNTYQGQVDILKNKFNDLVGGAMTRLLSTLEKAAVYIMEHKALLIAVGAVIGTLSTVILVGLIAAIIQTSVGFIRSGVEATISAAKMVAAAVVSAAAWVIANAAMIAGILLIAVVVAAVAALIITHWQEVKDFFAAVWQKIQDGAHAVIDWIKDHWQLLVGILLGPVAFAVAEIITHWQQIKDAFNTVINTIKNAAANFGSLLANAGKDLIQGLINGITGTAGKVFDAVKNIGEQAVNKLKGVLKIFSPSKVFAELGGNISLGLAQGITDNAQSAVNATGDMANKVAGVGATVPSVNTSNNQNSQSVLYNFQPGSVVLQTAEAVDEFFSIGNRNTQLELLGGSPLPGTAGV